MVEYVSLVNFLSYIVGFMK